MATLTRAAFKHTIKWDAETDTWDVLDQDGDRVDSADMASDALDIASGLTDEAYESAKDEAEEEEAAELRYAIADKLEGLTLAELKKLARKLGA